MDNRRRSLERAALSSGSPDDEARVLLEKLRAEPPCTHCAGTGYLRRCGPNKFWSDANSRMAAADEVSGRCSSCAGTGSLLRARVECAAFAGHEAAVLVVGEVPPPSPGATGPRLVPSLGSWLAGLARYGVEAQVAAALGAARAVYAKESSGHRFYNAFHAIEAAEAWLDCPSAERMETWRLAWTACWGPGEALHHTWVPRPMRPDLSVLAAAEWIGEPAVREAAAAAVRRWALGGEA